VGEGNGGAIVFSERSLANFEPHCQYLQSYPEGQELCKADHCARASTAVERREEELTLCHAGLYNQAIPVKVGNRTRAVLLYGEMLIDDGDGHRKSLENHERLVERLQLDDEDAAELRQYLLSAKTYTPQRLTELKTFLPRVEQWFYTVIDEEDRLKASIDRVSHDMQTRLQAVIANAENLVYELPPASPEPAKEMARSVLFSALALDTLVQTLGHYLEDYDFRERSIGPLIYEAKRVYEAEAARRGIEIRVHLKEVSKYQVLISANHLQHAINNLVHNAVKYSFRSGYGRQRFVQINGYPGDQGYIIEFNNYGVGILPDEIASGAVFQDGYQGQLTRDEYRTGSGKGLYFVKQVVEQHHGRIEVESRSVADDQDPEGQPHLTRFTLYVPYQK
jgi:signal transduction histidine kinase